MPKSEDENRRIREAQRENILKAAKSAVLRNGWSVTMADIAAEAKISQGLAYRYFENKEAIFAELFHQMADKMINLKENPDDCVSPTRRLSALMNRILMGTEFVGDFEIAVRASHEKTSIHSLMDCVRNGDFDAKKLTEIMKSRLNALSELVTAIILEGQKTGEFIIDDPKKLTLILLSGVKGLTHLAIHQPDLFKTYYPYSDVLMRLVINHNFKVAKVEDNQPQ